MSVADYTREWEYLSKDHETKDGELGKTLGNYRLGKQLQYMAYAVLGTYGVGKTHFLYHIHKQAIQRGILPLYFLVEDLLREIITQRDKTWTPGDVYSLIEGKISSISQFLASGEASEVQNILDPRGKTGKDSPEVVESVLENYSRSMPENPKVILLVDELEGQYGHLQDIVQTKDRSPLRAWLESKTHLKYLAFAPAGIYELGGADRDRVKRIVIPPADVRYIRDNLVKDAGTSNSCWWLSRGKARQLFKTVEVLGSLEPRDVQDAAKASRIIGDELDSIGQPPTEVPPAITNAITPSKIPFLLSLAPVTCEARRRYVIDTDRLSTGELADRVIEAFGTNKDVAVRVAEYFKRTVLALSDERYITYVDERELPELFCLVLDHFLEYEHGSPELSKTLGGILGLYEKSREDHAAMHGTIGTLWERREIERGLPLSIVQIRGAFPFPTMNPIVKGYVPDEMKRKWEGRNLPLWTWTEGNITFLFFASARDFIAYSEMDEFLSLCLPDGRGVLALLPYGEDVKKTQKKPLFKWLEENGKLKIIRLQPLLTDFLLSASGELASTPGNLQVILQGFREDKEDVLLSRKTEIYEKALSDTVKDVLPKPEKICKGPPPDADSVWGRTQIQYRMIAVSGIALTFPNLPAEEKLLLADLRELFKGGREGRGIGDLRYLISARDAPGKGGHTRLPDRLLPYRAKGTGIKNTENIEKLKGYWRSGEIDNLEKLARILPLDDFLKLHEDEDIGRLLEALWRTVRQEFDIAGLDGFAAKLEKDIIPTLKACHDLETRGSTFGLEGIDFGGYTQLVKSLDGFKQLLAIVTKAADASPLAGSLISILVETTSDVDADIKALDNLCSNARRATERLSDSAESLRQNFWEYKRAVKFVGLTEDDLDNVISEQMRIQGTYDPQGVESAAGDMKEYLEQVSTSLSQLEGKLKTLEDLFASVRGGT